MGEGGERERVREWEKEGREREGEMINTKVKRISGTMLTKKMSVEKMERYCRCGSSMA